MNEVIQYVFISYDCVTFLLQNIPMWYPNDVFLNLDYIKLLYIFLLYTFLMLGLNQGPKLTRTGVPNPLQIG